MTTAIQILGWEAQGLRCPDHKLSFEEGSDKVYPITLIQMPNGTGKTTTLDLLRATLSGSAIDENWDRSKVRSLRKRGNDRGSGMFRVFLLHNSRRLTITMEFDFQEGTFRYTTTKPAGIEEGFHPPQDLRRFLKTAFVNFFVFDGELAEQLLKREHTKAQVAIENLFQLNIFSTLINRVREYYERDIAQRPASDTRWLTRYRNQVSTLGERIAALKVERAEKEKEYAKVQGELKRKEVQFQEALLQQRNLRVRIQKAAGELANASSNVKYTVKETISQMRSPQALSAIFAKEMITLKSSLDKAKLPESVAKEFFKELAEEPMCVCGREIDEESRRNIIERASKYLDSNDVSLLNQIKGDVAKFVGTDSDSEEVEKHENNLKDILTRLEEYIQKESECENLRDEIEAEGIANDPDLERVKEEITQLEERRMFLETELEKYDDQTETAGDKDTYGIQVLEKRWKEAETKLAEVTQTIGMKKKRDLLLGILERAKEKASIGIREELCAKTNGKIAELMPYNAIRVEEVSSCLVLSGQEGGSVGETLSVAYAFLATLFDRAEEHQLPFVVDSPANPIDLTVRSKVAELIPRLSRQFIAFTISSERQGFLPSLEQSAKGNIQYLTLFRRGAEDLERQATRESGHRVFTDGLCITGRRFFNQFQLNEEEENDGVQIES